MSERLSYENGVEVGYERGLKAAHEDPNILASHSWDQGFASGLDAAREAVAAVEQYVNIPYESPSPAMNGEQGDWLWRRDALAAIDALRGEA